MDNTLEKMMAVANLEVYKVQCTRKSLNARIQKRKLKIRENELENIKLHKELVSMMEVTDLDLKKAYIGCVERIKELKKELDWK